MWMQCMCTQAAFHLTASPSSLYLASHNTPEIMYGCVHAPVCIGACIAGAEVHMHNDIDKCFSRSL